MLGLLLFLFSVVFGATCGDVVASKNHSMRTTTTRKKLQLSTKFPSLDDALEMTVLSSLIYMFRTETDDKQACEMLNEKDYAAFLDQDELPESAITKDLHCHWYYHDRDHEGTQVMIVSSFSKRYIAVVFAGTDDLKTALTDTNVWMKPFGDGANLTLPDPRIRVHAGFNNAVFGNHIFRNIVRSLEHALLHGNLPRSVRLFTTGHSLGAANSILAAVGLTVHFRQQQQGWKRIRRKSPLPITSLNVGCPRMGNRHWRDFLHSGDDSSKLVKNLGIWRIVFGLDLIPRLPEFFLHAGHTIQLRVRYRHSKRTEYSANATIMSTAARRTFTTALAYYEHYGDPCLGYAGVPCGWATKPYVFLPIAVFAHHIRNYFKVLNCWSKRKQPRRQGWVKNFVCMHDENKKNENIDATKQISGSNEAGCALKPFPRCKRENIGFKTVQNNSNHNLQHKQIKFRNLNYEVKS